MSIIGNYENKYSNKENFISKILVRRYLKNFKYYLNFVKSNKIKRISEFGAGEGYLSKITHSVYPNSELYISDISNKYFKNIKSLIKSKKVYTSVQNVEKTMYQNDYFDLSICNEVLEHVKEPTDAVKELNRVTKGYLIVTVPLEPFWRLLNILRLKYLSHLGNTPGHVNHWFPSSILYLIKKNDFNIVRSKVVFPWFFILAKNDQI